MLHTAWRSNFKSFQEFSFLVKTRVSKAFQNLLWCVPHGLFLLEEVCALHEAVIYIVQPYHCVLQFDYEVTPYDLTSTPIQFHFMFPIIPREGGNTTQRGSFLNIHAYPWSLYGLETSASYYLGGLSISVSCNSLQFHFS